MSTQSSEIRHFRLALVVALLGAVGALALAPYAVSLTAGNVPLPLPVPILAISSALQIGLLLIPLSWMGLRLGFPLGLDMPLLRAWVYRQPLPPISQSALKGAIAIGGVGSLLLLGLDLVFQPWLPPAVTSETPSIALWKRLLASFYGGITEELLVRLFGMTVVVWLLSRLVKRQNAHPPQWVYWGAIVTAALLFGVGHLPAAAMIWPLTPVVILRVITLNALLGVPFGWLYWRWGLEYAMWAHFCADIVLQGLAGSWQT